MWKPLRASWLEPEERWRVPALVDATSSGRQMFHLRWDRGKLLRVSNVSRLLRW